MKRLPLLLLLCALACNRGEAAKSDTTSAAPPPPIGDATRGPQLARQYGCNACHTIPGIDGPPGSLGPSLQGLASRPAISMGTVQNTPANLLQFIQDPATLNPNSSMPPMMISETDANDLVAYLLTLK